MKKSLNPLNNWQYAKDGIILWLNNKPLDAEVHFKKQLENTETYAAYAFTTVMNAVISYDQNMIIEAQSMLRELEQRCTFNESLLNSIKIRIFNPILQLKPMLQTLEEKIILADSLLCSAILTFLTQDITCYMKTSWFLRRAWKIYHKTYTEVYEIYNNQKKYISESIDYLPAQPESSQIKMSLSDFMLRNINSIPQSRTTIFSNYNLQEKFHNYKSPQCQKLYNFIVKCDSSKSQQKESNSLNSSQKKPSKSELSLYINNNTNSNNEFSPQVPLSCPTGNIPSFYETNNRLCNNNIKKDSIERLMGAVSFGYGIFQLCISLLPANISKLINFFGFEGNQNKGITALLYCTSSNDMRAPIAMLALLWYLTFGTQIYYLENSGCTQDIIVENILKNSHSKYAASSLFLFFRGRKHRLQGEIKVAIEYYDAAYRVSAQKEIKHLCLHEVGWCRLIDLDFGNAMLHFHELKVVSYFSKCFYCYMSAICQGAFGHFENLSKLRSEMVQILSTIGRKEIQIEKYVQRRIQKFPENPEEIFILSTSYWKFLIYEMLFLWNIFPTCSTETLETIVSDCCLPDDNLKEPSIGLSKLIIGACKIKLGNTNEAINSFRACIKKRENINEDMHLTAFACYELAILLIKQETDEAKIEALTVLQKTQSFCTGYDFETILNGRIYSILKKLKMK